MVVYHRPGRSRPRGVSAPLGFLPRRLTHHRPKGLSAKVGETNRQFALTLDKVAYIGKASLGLERWEGDFQVLDLCPQKLGHVRAGRPLAQATLCDRVQKKVHKIAWIKHA